jgi:hypothetical protein
MHGGFRVNPGPRVRSETPPLCSKGGLSLSNSGTGMKAASSYLRLLHRYLLCAVACYLSCVVGAVSAVFDVYAEHGLAVAAATAATCSLGAAVTFYRLFGLHCPSCRNRLIQAKRFDWPRNRCKHCDFDLDLAE